MDNELALKMTKQEAWSHIRRDLLSWPMLISFGLILTGPLWYSVLIIFFMWTFLFDPYSVFVFSLLILDVVFTVYCWIKFFKTVIQRGIGMKELRRAALAGDVQAKDQYLERRKQIRSMTNPAHIMSKSYVAIHLLIPIGVSLIVYGGTTEGTYAIRDHGKLRAATRKEGVQIVLNRLHKKGLFWFID